MKRANKVVAFDIRKSRAINISLDIEHPERLAGYVPTEKSVQLTNAIFDSLTGKNSNRAFSIAAPYGSGKSSIGLLWAVTAEHGTKKLNALRHILDALRKVDKDTTPFDLYSRRGSKSVVLVLNGFHTGIIEDLLDALEKSLNRIECSSVYKKVKNHPKTLDGLFKTFQLIEAELQSRRTSLLIVWDEFGKVLEHCAAVGDSRALLEIQSIAEFCSRSEAGFPIVLSMLMHQSFSQYASHLPTYVRTEWAKIEGRFQQINYIEDSREIYQLIAQLVNRKFGKPIESRKVFKDLARTCHEVNLFRDFELSVLEDLLYTAAPLTPVSLYLLPRLSARVAQNERTLFTFLCGDEANSLVNIAGTWADPSYLFDFFSDLMQADSGFGGTHRNWVETQMALKKTNDHISEKVIKALASIKLCSSNGSIQGNLETVALAFGNYNKVAALNIETCINELLASKAIFHKRITQEFSIWQGSDVDIRSAVTEAKVRIEPQLDLVEFLTQEYPASCRVPQRHNDQNHITRYFDGRYVNLEGLKALVDWDLSLGQSDIRDGRIFYVICETKKEIEEACAYTSRIKVPRAIFAIPKRPLNLRESAAELKSYFALLIDPDFTGKDPVVEQELKHLADDTQEFVQKHVDLLRHPSQNGPNFYYKGKRNDAIGSLGDLKRFLSKVADELFPSTPCFNNELINRADPSAQIVNARKKLIRAILIDGNKENFGLTGYGPEVAIFRALFLSTKLYREHKDGKWGITASTRGLDPTLAAVWKELTAFWSEPSISPKNTQAFLDRLTSPPFGLREGVLSILLAASYKVTVGTINIMEDGIYVRAVKDMTFERLARSPRAFQITIPELSKDLKNYLDNIIEVFGGHLVSSDPVQNAIASIVRWSQSLPPVAIERNMVSVEADQFIDVLKIATNPIKFFSEDLTRIFSTKDFALIFDKLRVLKSQCEAVEPELVAQCRQLLLSTVGAEANSDLVSTLRAWKATLPGDKEAYLVDRLMAGFLTRMDQAYNKESDSVLSLASHLTGKSLRFWDARGLLEFELKLVQTMKQIDDLADSIDMESAKGDTSRISLPWMEKRLRTQFVNLKKRLGSEATRKIVNTLLEGI